MIAAKKTEGSLKNLRTIGILTTIPMVMVAGLLVGYFAGNWIDGKFHVSPWGKLVVSLLGVIAGFKQTIRLIKDAMNEPDDSKK